MKTLNRVAAYAALIAFACTSVVAVADDHAYTEGLVVNVARIRTVDGKFDEYMKYVATTWKSQQEAAKKLGYIVSYEVFVVEPRTADDPDLFLITRYKNWAALDGALAKEDEVVKAVGTTPAASSQARVARASLRRVLGSSTMQVLELK